MFDFISGGTTLYIRRLGLKFVRHFFSHSNGSKFSSWSGFIGELDRNLGIMDTALTPSPDRTRERLTFSFTSTFSLDKSTSLLPPLILCVLDSVISSAGDFITEEDLNLKSPPLLEFFFPENGSIGIYKFSFVSYSEYPYVGISAMFFISKFTSETLEIDLDFNLRTKSLDLDLVLLMIDFSRKLVATANLPTYSSWRFSIFSSSLHDSSSTSSALKLLTQLSGRSID
mmetsp:Transcript_35190/g.69361  ORF Transcript_35190/g.69361 Transcript_35190/m.69361 type:complete len:228 (+) Transcript_35190:1045-1728(+)